MSRVEENQKMIDRIGNVRFSSGDMAMLASVLTDISQSLAVIADKMHPKEIEKSCRNCRFWGMDVSNPERKCSACYELDEWQKAEEDRKSFSDYTKDDFVVAINWLKTLMSGDIVNE